MPFVIGLFFLSTILAILVIVSKIWLTGPIDELNELIKATNVSGFILDILLGFLLFAGALHTDWARLKEEFKKVTFFALIGVTLSTFIIAGLFFLLCNALSFEINFLYCLIFGALISPTDPIAVLGIMRQAGVPKKIETLIIGESLFNDGIGVVLFLALLKAASNVDGFSAADFSILFIQEAVGGVIFGLAFGWLLHRLMRRIDHYETEVFLSLAFVMAGYSIASFFHLSGPLAMVVMGLLVGNYKSEAAMSDVTHEYMLKFWELIELVLNGILFTIVALLIASIGFTSKEIIIGVISIVILLISRMIIVFLPKLLFPKLLDFTNKEAKIIVWGGLRGGLSIALVLSLPDSDMKHLLLVATYICVVFSILVQGLTVGKLAATK
jgi:CPA1 family monovalent cation:H+ antiporter